MSDIKKMSFEQAFAELEETVQKLEEANLPLAEAIALYRQGMALAEQCGLQLDQAELTIKSLSPGGEPVDFAED